MDDFFLLLSPTFSYFLLLPCSSYFTFFASIGAVLVILVQAEFINSSTTNCALYLHFIFPSLCCSYSATPIRNISRYIPWIRHFSVYDAFGDDLMASSRSMTEARGRCVGQICENPIKDSPTVPCTGKKIYDGEQVIIGRDPNKCNYVVYDPTVSCKHLRIYTIIVDQDDVSGVPPLVYAEDLSRNGTYWNNALMGKGRGGFLLSDNDVLQISSRINLVFKQHIQGLVELIDDIQEREIQVRSQCLS